MTYRLLAWWMRVPTILLLLLALEVVTVRIANFGVVWNQFDQASRKCNDNHGKLDPVVGRQPQIKCVTQILGFDESLLMMSSHRGHIIIFWSHKQQKWDEGLN